MKKLFIIPLAFLLFSCNTDREDVNKVRGMMQKTAMVEVYGVRTVVSGSFTEKSFEFHKSTAAYGVCGAAVYISENGHLLTVAHLFADKVDTVTIVSWDGVRQPAELLYKDESKDLALLKVTGHWWTHAMLVDPDDIQVGQTVFAVGNPMELEWSVSKGIISAVGRNKVELIDSVQSDAAINPGNSGGPLFASNGKLVGIVSRFKTASNEAVYTGLGFSVGPRQIKEFIDKFVLKAQEG